jgi:hypothetical protein
MARGDKFVAYLSHQYLLQSKKLYFSMWMSKSGLCV